MIEGCLAKRELPVYGKGVNVRDWLFVEDHARALWLIVQKGKKGENYNIGGKCELKNIDLLELLIERVAKVKGENPKKYTKLITYVKDRPGHDLRYSLNCEKLEKELGWSPSHPIEEGIDQTIAWCLHGE